MDAQEALRDSKGVNKTRVLIDMVRDGKRWSTVGASPNIIEASWMALVDGIEYGLMAAYAEGFEAMTCAVALAAWASSVTITT